MIAIERLFFDARTWAARLGEYFRSSIALKTASFFSSLTYPCRFNTRYIVTRETLAFLATSLMVLRFMAGSSGMSTCSYPSAQRLTCQDENWEEFARHHRCPISDFGLRGARKSRVLAQWFAVRGNPRAFVDSLFSLRPFGFLPLCVAKTTGMRYAYEAEIARSRAQGIACGKQCGPKFQ